MQNPQKYQGNALQGEKVTRQSLGYRRSQRYYTLRGVGGESGDPPKSNANLPSDGHVAVNSCKVVNRIGNLCQHTPHDYNIAVESADKASTVDL
jgi:hypothetical protein